MKEAIEVVKTMKMRAYRELDEVQGQYEKTRSNNIYDVGYRRILEQSHDRLIRKCVVLDEVIRELEGAEHESNE